MFNQLFIHFLQLIVFYIPCNTLRRDDTLFYINCIPKQDSFAFPVQLCSFKSCHRKTPQCIHFLEAEKVLYIFKSTATSFFSTAGNECRTLLASRKCLLCWVYLQYLLNDNYMVQKQHGTVILMK